MANNLLNKEQKEKIGSTVDQLLHEYTTDFNQWQVLKSIADKNGIELKQAPLQDISGILYKDQDEKWKIIVNQDDSNTRKLFTTAHELGHFFLHRDESEKFIDSELVQACFGRTELTKFQKKEIEANEFAGELLMPESIIKRELKDNKDGKPKREKVEQLAAKFNVSTLAMITRLRNLGYDA
ncbi:ImmA/IrrE family metallo-endopeptidase [Candidatus Peregrinibacteria bacterium]|nr:ImmA/IrrE family metallo-endopeptidase [Candidatus Peregrinibacteria bacterium]